MVSVKLSKNSKLSGEKHFYGCPLLKTIEIPESVDYLGNCSFGNCYNLREVILPIHLRYWTLSRDVFNNSNLSFTNITIKARSLTGDIFELVYPFNLSKKNIYCPTTALSLKHPDTIVGNPTDFDLMLIDDHSQFSLTISKNKYASDAIRIMFLENKEQTNVFVIFRSQ